jgi:hypothetical protein
MPVKCDTFASEKPRKTLKCYFRGRCIDFSFPLLLRISAFFALTMTMVLGVFIIAPEQFFSSTAKLVIDS